MQHRDYAASSLVKWITTIAVVALVVGTILMRGYMTVGWHHFDMPYPHIIGPMFHLDGESGEDAVYFELWLEFVAISAIGLAGARFVWKRLFN
jgi:hypothetical protein